jgi:glycosyltransferase involved in cell wall biosynthesis
VSENSSTLRPDPAAGGAARARPRHVGIIVQNLPVPLDRRVWNECRALRAAGYDVSVICPKGPGDPGHHEIDGVQLHKYRPAPARDGMLALVYETIYCWLRTAWLAWRIHRRHPFDALQACNPPDTFWLLGAFFKTRGVRFVFDHHDLCPEIYMARYRAGGPSGRGSGGGGLVLRVLLALERATFGTADHVISTNESYRRVALERGRRRPEETTVVRSGPEPDELRPAAGDPAVRRGRRHLCTYVGIMGHQDGADVVIRAADLIVNQWGHDDVGFAMLGFGDTLDSLRALTTELGLDDHVTFTGRVGTEEIQRYLSSSVIGLSPDPRSAFNEASTMNKTLEYMACGLPVVAYDLRETRVSAGDAARYATDDSIEAFAKAIVSLLDDPEAREQMGRMGRQAIEDRLGWPAQVPIYVGVYDRLLGRS